MRIGLFADVHGNVVALDAVLRELRDVDQLVCLGDVPYGPCPSASLKIVRGLGCPVVAGNAEVWLADETTLEREALLQPKFLASHRANHRKALAWTRDQLTGADLDYLRSLPRECSLDLPGGRRLHCYHGSPRHYFDFLLPTTPAPELDAMIASTDADILIGGHTHQQMLRRHGGRLILNAGSVGRVPARTPWPAWWPRADELPADDGQPDYRASAEFVVLEVTAERIDVHFGQIAVPADEIVTMLRDSGMPGAQSYFGELEPFHS